MSRKPLIAVAGLASENSTFTPSRTRLAAFHIKRGDEITNDYTFLRPGSPLSGVAEWKGALIGRALPGGIIARDAFETLSEEIVARLRDMVAATHLDGLWFDIHGAMNVEGLEDAEVDLLRRIRKVIGPEIIVSASMDLHGNVSQELAHGIDLLTCYRTAPHVDVRETKERACRNLVELLQQHPRGTRPLKAWIPIPILLPGEQTSTRDEPAKTIYKAVPDVAELNGVIDAAIWVGYAWADEPRNRAIVMVTGWEKQAVSSGAEKLARLFWNLRNNFQFVAPTGSFAECLDGALSSSARPYFISDSGDNPTAGGSGDMTWGLTQLLARPEFKDFSGPTVIYASVPGSEAVETAVKAGIGATVTITAGAEVDSNHAGPITMTGKVHSIKHGDPHAHIEVVLQIGSVYAILTKLRKPYHKERDFTDLNLIPRSVDIVIVKIGYLEPELYDMSADWMLGLTPGGVDQDLKRLGHHHIRRPMWPFDTEFEEPNLTARFVPMSNEAFVDFD